MHVQFLKPDAYWSDWHPISVLLDTGATHTHISKSVVPEIILETYKDRTHQGRAATADLLGILVPNVYFLLPSTKENDIPTMLFLPEAIVYDDSEVKQIKLKEKKSYTPVIFGMDLLQLGILAFNGPEKTFSFDLTLPT